MEGVDLTLFSHGTMVDGLQFDDEHSEAVGESTADNGDDEDSEANEPALAVLSQRRPQLLQLHRRFQLLPLRRRLAHHGLVQLHPGNHWWWW